MSFDELGYTVSKKNLEKTIEFLAQLKCELNEMERKHGSSVTKYDEYNFKSEKFVDEEIMLTLLLGTEMQEVIETMITKRTHEIERSRKSRMLQ